MLASIIHYKKITADDDDVAGLVPGTLIHGVIGNTTSASSAASIVIHDAATVSGSNPILVVAADQGPTAGNYQATFGVMFPYPVKCYTNVSVDVTNCDAFVYYS